MRLLIKVCGLKEPGNIRDVAGLDPDLMGFIFHSLSPRFVGEIPDPNLFTGIPARIAKTGVFVNTKPEIIVLQGQRAHFRYIQLHGDESPDNCQYLATRGFEVIKAFRIHSSFSFALLKPYYPCCRYFLFDTYSESFGGSGNQFDWNILYQYNGPVPFFLSGGIGPDDADKILQFQHPLMAGVDVNSRFETAPGIKDVPKLKTFITMIRNREV